MRILYLSQYFPPEAGATQSRAHDFARYFVSRGHEVTMLTEVPNHPSGVILPEFSRKLYTRSVLDGIDVIRVWVKASSQKSFRSRVLFYLSYMFNAILAGLFLSRGRYDLIYATSPPLFVGAAALTLSFIRRTPLIFEVRDLWPESAVVLGEINNPRYISWSTRLEEACYRRAHKIIIVTKGVFGKLIERGYSTDKIGLIPNGADIGQFSYREKERSELRRILGVENKFLAIYAGILGIAQGIETIIECAKLLRDDHRFYFVLIGEGPKKIEIIDLVHRYKLDNVSVLPEQPRDVIPDFLSAADVALIPLRKLDLFKITIPSKLFDAWACERPVILSIDGEARRILEHAGAGIYVPPENPESMAAALNFLVNNPLERSKMGKSGREYTIINYSRQVLSEQLLQILEEVAYSKKA